MVSAGVVIARRRGVDKDTSQYLGGIFFLGGSVMESPFNGLGMHLGNLSRLSNARTRSISAENPDGAKGRGGMASEETGAYVARELGQGWKVSPSLVIPRMGWKLFERASL